MSRSWVLVALLCAAGGVWASEGDSGHWHGSQSIPLHRMNLVDAEGATVVPTAPQPMPFSARQTCGPCHKYDTIQMGRHFNAIDSKAAGGRPSEPWVVVDQATGTIVPVSSRRSDGVFAPADLGLTPWSFALRFGRHMPGGGAGEMAPESESTLDPSRWSISGEMEINCLACHSGSFRQDHSEWAKQIARENLRWAATASSGLGDVGGLASRAKATWNIFDGPNRDDHKYAVPPFVRYDLSQFDTKGRALLDIVRPTDDRCLTCHSTHEVGEHRMDAEPDVHTAAGLACVDCHRNGLDHEIVRGYESETHERDDRKIAALSCRGCHLGAGHESVTGVGRLGAPHAEHRGMPPIHFEKLTCTACHSAGWPGNNPVEVRTARANRMGIYGIAEWSMDYPRIAEPVFMKGKDGKIGPHRMLWPSFWGILEGDQVRPLAPESVTNTAVGILDAEQQVGDILSALQVDAGLLQKLVGADEEFAGTPVAVAGGKIYRRDIDGKLDRVQYRGSKKPPEGGSVRWGYLVEERYRPILDDQESEDIVISMIQALDWDRDSGFVRTYTKYAAENPGMRTPERSDALYLDATGGLQVVEQPGPIVRKSVWGWLRFEEGLDVPREFIQSRGADSLHSKHGIARKKVADVLGKLADINQERITDFREGINVIEVAKPWDGFPAFVESGQAYRLGSEGQFRVLKTQGEVPDLDSPWVWMTEAEIVPLCADVDPASEHSCKGRAWETAEEVSAKESGATLALATVLEKLGKSSAASGVPVVALNKGRILTSRKAVFLPITKDAYEDVVKQADAAKKSLQVEMDALNIVFEKEEENYFRKIDWRYKKVPPARFFRDDDLKDLQELEDYSKRAEKRRARQIAYGPKYFGKYIELSPAEVEKLRAEVEVANDAVTAEMKAKSLVFEKGKYYQMTDDGKERFYYIREKKAGSSELYKLVVDAQKAQDKLASLREYEGCFYRQAQSDDPDLRLVEVPGAVSGGTGVGLRLLKEGLAREVLPTFIVEGAVAACQGPALFTEAQVGHMLERLNGTMPGKTVVFVSNGKLYKLNAQNKVVGNDHDAAAPAAWPVAHRVRPASQSLGVRHCMDCHTEDAPFFFAEVAALGPMATDRVATVQMHELQDLDGDFQRLFGLSFKVRSLFKIAMIGFSALIAGVMLLFMLLALRRVVVYAGSKDKTGGSAI